MWQVSVTDLSLQVLGSSRDLQARHDKQLEVILTSFNPKFDRLESQVKDLGTQISKVEKDVTFIRAVGTVVVVLLTLAIKIPSSVWEKLFSIEP